ncbi:MAG: RebB family R body protein [Aliidongia sp.]
MPSDSQTSGPVDARVLATAPAVALQTLYQGISKAMVIAVQNAVAAQQQANITAQAVVTMGVSTLYAIDTATLGQAAAKEIGKPQ